MKAGVPQNMILSGTDRLPLAVFSQLADFALDDVAFEHAEMGNKKNSVEMIDFVAEGAGQQAFAAHFKFLPGYVVRPHGDVLGTRHVTAESRHRQATFFLALLTFGMNDLGGSRRRVLLRDFLCRLRRQSPPRARPIPILRRGEAHALSGVHGLEHVAT